MRVQSRILIALTAVMLVAPVGRADDADGVARAAVAGYAANLRSFDPVRCGYTYRQGDASNEANAKAGRLVTVQSSCRAVLTMAGSRIRIDNLGVPFNQGMKGKSAEAIPGTGLKRVPVDFCVQGVYMSNGSEDMAFDTGTTVNIYTPDLPCDPRPPNPLATGAFDWRLQSTPDRMLDQPGRFQFRGEGVQSLDGKPTIRARFVDRDNSSEFVVDFDPARSYLPLRTEVWNTGAGPKGSAELLTTSWLIDAKDCGGGRFFPMRSVTITTPDSNSHSWCVWETSVTSLDADYRPPSTAFEYKLPKGTPLLHFRSDRQPMLSLKQDETITPENLTQFLSRMTFPRSQADVAGRRRPRWWLWVAIGSVGVYGIVVAAVKWGRPRRDPGLPTSA